jgi:hypothetical protein
MAAGAAIAGIIAWLAVAVRLGLDFAGRRRNRKWQSTGFRWMGSGLLVVMTGVVLVEWADYRNWPYSQRHDIATMLLIFALPALACVFVGLAVETTARAADHMAAANPPTD